VLVDHLQHRLLRIETGISGQRLADDEQRFGKRLQFVYPLKEAMNLPVRRAWHGL
jgi:hypothetical protein